MGILPTELGFLSHLRHLVLDIRYRPVLKGLGNRNTHGPIILVAEGVILSFVKHSSSSVCRCSTSSTLGFPPDGQVQPENQVHTL